VLFAGTVRDNILYGAMQGTTDEDVQRAAELANAHDFIMELAEGYDTQVGCRLADPLPLSLFLAEGRTIQNIRKIKRWCFSQSSFSTCYEIACGDTILDHKGFLIASHRVVQRRPPC
jgi:hypothetical protein